MSGFKPGGTYALGDKRQNVYGYARRSWIMGENRVATIVVRNTYANMKEYRL